jgi:Tfp pilus assembly protein PilF
MIKNLFAMIIFTFVLLTVSSACAQDLIQQDEYHRDLAKTHFDLAIKQFDDKDLFAACSNLRISMGHARHLSDNKAYDHIVYLIGKKCDGSN